MSDSKLRDLERRWKETGAVEDEAAYLLERVRVGDLTRPRLELAAALGESGARAALNVFGDLPRTYRAFTELVAGRRVVEALDTTVLIAEVLQSRAHREYTRRAAIVAADATRALMRADGSSRERFVPSACSAWWDVCGMDVLPRDCLGAKDVVRIASVAAERCLDLDALRQALIERALH